MAFRHRRVPFRTFGDSVIVARPSDGTSVVIESAAALVWRALEVWCTADDVDRCLSQAYPDVPREERVAAWRLTLKLLEDEDLVERK
jgi:hypothetical protein